MIHVTSVIEGLNFGGGENRLLNQVKGVDRDRFTIRVVTIFRPDPLTDSSLGDMREEFEAAGTDVINLGIRRPYGKRTLVIGKLLTASMLTQAVSRLHQVFRRHPTDFADTHLESAGLIGSVAALSARIPSSMTLYNMEPPDTYAFRKQIHPWLMRRAAVVITDSDTSADDFTNFAHLGPGKVQVIANGVRLSAPSCSRACLLREWGIPQTATIVGQISGLVPYKGHRVLLDAAKMFLRDRPETYLVLVGFPRGGADYVNSLQKQASALGIQERVRIRSYPGNISDVWQAIDLHVHASLLDSLPNAIIEGMSLGKPAVVTEVGGIARAVSDGTTGLTVKPGDVAELGNAVLRLLTDRSYAFQLGRAAQLRYNSLYTPEVMCRKIERCWLRSTHDV